VAVKVEVVSISGLSAHADAAQLVQWLKTTPPPPRRVFITHGEPAAADALRRRIEHDAGLASHGAVDGTHGGAGRMSCTL
jgi:metallo-beta-lactamase family protein